MSIQIKDYNEKSILVSGETINYKDNLKEIGGLWNPTLKGWIFSISKKDKVTELINNIKSKVIVGKKQDTSFSITKEDYMSLVSRIEWLEQKLAKQNLESSDDESEEEQIPKFKKTLK